MTSADVREAFGAKFAGAAGFLNSPTYGLPPESVVDALHDCIAHWRAGTLDVPAFDEHTRAARTGYAALAGVPVESVAMGSSVSGMLGLVAAAIPDDSRVAVVPGEFTSTTFPFAAQTGRGVTVTEVPADELVATADRYDVVAVSLVQSATGAVLDTAALRRTLDGADTLTVIDITQAAGWMNLDVDWADVTVAAVYKWLLAPRGTAMMSVSDRMSRLMTPHTANWFAGEDPWQSIYGLPLRLAADARRFNLSPTWFSVLGAAHTLPWLASLDRAAVERHAVGLVDRVRGALGLPPHPSAIVSLPIDGAAHRLAAAGVRASVRAGAVRVGFHLYNDDSDVDALLAALG
jgi:selenocysteine lyase/cysteine desulfurase